MTPASLALCLAVHHARPQRWSVLRVGLCPAVAEAAVIGLPHPALGEEVGAAVVVKPGADVTAEQLIT